jgi:hypothetical protein
MTAPERCVFDARQLRAKKAIAQSLLRIHAGRMIENALKLVVSAGLLLISAGAWPGPRYGGAIAIGFCLMAAVALHVVAP